MPQRHNELVLFVRRTFGAAALAVLALAGVLIALIIEHGREHSDQPFSRLVGVSAVVALAIVLGVLFVLRRRILAQAEETSVGAAALDLRNAQLIDQADRMDRQQIEKDQQAAQLQDALAKLETQKADLQIRSQELERIVDALRASEGRFRSLVDSLHDVVFTIGLDGRYRALYGGAKRDERTLRSYIGQTPIDILGPELGQGHVDAFERAVRGQAVTHEWSLEGPEPRHFISTMSPLRGPRGEIEGVVGVTRDTTDQVRRDNALSLARDQLRQSQRLEALGQLAGGVAHDFNNLLTVIMTYAAILHEDAAPGSDERRSVEEITDASERAAALTRQLLAFSRRQVLQPELLDLNEAVRQLETMLRRLLTEGVELDIDLGRGLGRVMADPAQIEQVLINLAINARDAMPDGGRLTIVTSNVDFDGANEDESLPLEGPYVMITVSDTGVGMTADVLAKVFDPFFTTKDVGKGTGLGLSMVHGIVEQSGGRIVASSELGQGASFRIYLPRVTGQAEVITPPGPMDLGGSESVLLVDDNDELRRVVRRMLERAGYQVHEAANGVAALTLLDRSVPVDIVISDVIMPELGGRGVVEAVRQRHANVRLLLMSGYNYDTALRGMAQRGDVAFLEKPFTAEKLLRKLRDVLGEPAGSSVA